MASALYRLLTSRGQESGVRDQGVGGEWDRSRRGGEIAYPEPFPDLHSFVIRSYRDLHVWQLGIRLVIESYKVGQQLPSDERFGLTAQIGVPRYPSLRISRKAMDIPRVAIIAITFGSPPAHCASWRRCSRSSPY